MGDAKKIRVMPIARHDADKIIKSFHYSGKVVSNSQLSLGVFLDGRCLGAMQFGPSLDKRKVGGLVLGTQWNNFLELNRMAFSDELPKNSESRALSIALRMIQKRAPHVEWIVSFADGSQCGDGTIYRAAGFVLTGIKRNTQVWSSPSGEKFARVSMTKSKNMVNGAASMQPYIDAGFIPLQGYQFRYVYFINREARQRLTVSEIPFSKIKEIGGSMYRGFRYACAGVASASNPSTQDVQPDPHAPSTADED